jgi:diguanylate cyclase (GGDEF)-like protein/PAS domain S-box-containing protein
METTLNILHLEDDKQDTELVEALLLAEGIQCALMQVETQADFTAAIERGGIDLIIADFTLPSFDGFSALKIAHERAPEVPFIFFSGTMGEEAAIDSLLYGATDYVLKQRVKRLIPAVRRALHEVKECRERSLAEATLRLRNRALEASVNAILITNCTQPDNPIEYVNPAFERITGYSAAEVMGRNSRFLQRDDGDQPGLENINAALREQCEGHAVIRNYRKDGSLFWNEFHIAPVRDSSGRTTHFIGVLNDITETKRYQEQLEHQAKYDLLTNLPNRSLLYDRLAQAIIYAQRYRRLVGVAFVDLDRFKLINDSLGHNMGDRLLKTVAERLKSSVRNVDTVARLGGDEFMVVLYDQANEQAIVKVMQRILASVRQPFFIEGREFIITCSMGLSIYPQDGQDAETLLKNADAAMYRAKDQGRNNFQSYTPEIQEWVNERVALENNLRRALERQEFVLYYQPQIDLRSERIVGAEALIRWQHPEWGMVSPARFIPVAEETGMIIPIGEWVIRTACTQNKVWQASGLPPIVVSVNVSMRQFRQKDLAKSVAQLLQKTGLEAQYLELELTESLVMQNPQEAIATLQELKELGIKLAIDDFGTGYSSLAYLKRFPVDCLKIDQSFVNEITTAHDSTVIAQAIISLGHSLNIQVIAEGVESQQQLEFLCTHHCHEAQGYYFSKPVPPGEFMKFFTSNTGTGESGYE